MFVPLVPNWTNQVVAGYRYQTTVFAADDGTEYRAAARTSPRRSIEFSAWPLEQRRVRDYILRQVSTTPFRIADPTQRAAYTKAELAPGGIIFSVNRRWPWLRAGARVALVHRRHAVEAVVASVVDVEPVSPVAQLPLTLPASLARTYTSTGLRFPYSLPVNLAPVAPAEEAAWWVTLRIPTGDRWPAGTQVLPVVEGWFDTVGMEALTPGVVTGAVRFNVLPGSEQPPVVRKDYDIWANGREGLLHEPDWSSPLSIDYPLTIRQVDYERGVLESYDPVKFRGRTMSALHRCREEEARDIIDFFYRQRGRRGEFYRPTWTHDLDLAEPLQPGFTDVKFSVAGPEIALQFGDRAIYPAVMISLNNGTKNLAYIRSMESVSGKTVVNVKSTAFPAGLTMADINMVSWVSLCRLASDEISVAWLTRGVAEIMLPVEEIREIAPDPGAIIMAESTLRLLGSYTEAVVEGHMAPKLQDAVNLLYPEAVAALG